LSKKIIGLTKALLYYCKQHNNWSPEISDKPVFNLLEELSVHPNFVEYFDYETAEDIIPLILNNSNYQQKHTFSQIECCQFLLHFQKTLSGSSAIHWLIIPLKNAHLTKTFRFENFIFIGGTRDDKIKKIMRLSKISYIEANSRALHTENSRSPGFFDHPLLAIKVSHQTAFVHRIARAYASFGICILQALYWGHIYPNNKRPIVLGNTYQKCEHIAIYTKDNWRHRHVPFNFSFSCEFNLDWLKKDKYKKRFQDMFYKITSFDQNDSLLFRFKRGLRFFSKAIETENKKDAFDGLGLKILYLTIVAECILLEGDNEKRIRLTQLIPSLAKLPDYNLADCKQIVDQAYKWRSSFVHGGNEVFPDWNEDFSEGDTAKKIKIFQRMIGRLLSDAAIHIDFINKLSSQAENSDKKWIDYLRTEWEISLGLKNKN
jgi:hypothetical protein